MGPSVLALPGCTAGRQPEKRSAAGAWPAAGAQRAERTGRGASWTEPQRTASSSPIIVVISLAAWLVLVYWADSHPAKSPAARRVNVPRQATGPAESQGAGAGTRAGGIRGPDTASLDGRVSAPLRRPA